VFVAPSLDGTNKLRVKEFEIANTTRANAKVFSLQVNSNSSHHGYQRKWKEGMMLQFQSNMTKHRIRRATLVFVAAMAGSILLASIQHKQNEEISSSSSLRQHRRQLMSLVQYADPKTVSSSPMLLAGRRNREMRQTITEDMTLDIVLKKEEKSHRYSLLSSVSSSYPSIMNHERIVK
jgi:hypothetical protein